MQSVALTLALIGLLGIGAQWLAWRLRLPAIVFLLLIGLLLGPVGGLVDPEQLLGELLFPFVSLGVAVILFEGGLTLRLHELEKNSGTILRLVSVGVLVTWLGAGAAAWWLLGLSWEVAFLFGAVVTVTGPTVIGPLLRTVRPRAEIANVLRWEGILIDPAGALLAVLVFEYIVSGQQAGHTVWLFCKALLVGTAIGGAAALALARAFERHWVPDFLHNVTTLALVLGVFTASNALQHESGLLAVTIMGIVLANRKKLRIGELLSFKESLSVLMISLMFIVLAARVPLEALLQLGLPALTLIALLMFVVRPLAVWLSAIGSGLSAGDKLFIAWIGPRGIVAAAVSALFALQLEQAGYPQADLLVPLTFAVIVITVVLQSLTAKPLATRLGLAEPAANGVLIVGANRVGLALARTLRDIGVPVRVADEVWEQIATARMAGFDTYYGSVVSEDADRRLDLAGIGRLFALTENPERNALVCSHYRHVFGSEAVFTVLTEDEKNTDERRRIGIEHRGRPLFEPGTTLRSLDAQLAAGGELRSTLLTDSFTFDDYRVRYRDTRRALFAIDAEGMLYVGGDEEEPLDPKPGWQLVGLKAAG